MYTEDDRLEIQRAYRRLLKSIKTPLSDEDNTTSVELMKLPLKLMVHNDASLVKPIFYIPLRSHASVPKKLVWEEQLLLQLCYTILSRIPLLHSLI